MNFEQTIGKSFDIEFCRRLEFHLTRTFQNNPINKFDHFWCDGVTEPEKWRQDLNEFNKTKEIVTIGWIGLTSMLEEQYWMTIKLGLMSFERCLKGLNIEQCLPSDQSLDWVNVDHVNRCIVLQLL